MNIQKISPDKVSYNPATNLFEALVTLQTEQGDFRYPCAVEGSLKMPTRGAIFKLIHQAKRRHMERNDLCAHSVEDMSHDMTTDRFNNITANRKAA